MFFTENSYEIRIVTLKTSSISSFIYKIVLSFKLADDYGLLFIAIPDFKSGICVDHPIPDSDHAEFYFWQS